MCYVLRSIPEIVVQEACGDHRAAEHPQRCCPDRLMPFCLAKWRRPAFRPICQKPYQKGVPKLCLFTLIFYIIRPEVSHFFTAVIVGYTFYPRRATLTTRSRFSPENAFFVNMRYLFPSSRVSTILRQTLQKHQSTCGTSFECSFMGNTHERCGPENGGQIPLEGLKKR